MPLEETGLTRRGLDLEPKTQETGFLFELGSRIAKEFVKDELPVRVEGVIVSRRRVSNGVEIYEFRPDGFDSLTLSEQGHNLIPVRVPNPGVGGKNLKKK